MIKQSYFNTLAEALESEDLGGSWGFGPPIGYGETVGIVGYTAKGNQYISVYRDNNGRYERPIHYSTKMEPAWSPE